jgi:hypothetical protein
MNYNQQNYRLVYIPLNLVKTWLFWQSRDRYSLRVARLAPSDALEFSYAQNDFIYNGSREFKHGRSYRVASAIQFGL